ncbi:hypothetical protein [Paenibacillus sp. FSL R10-2734]|uniref:hypothetical protein n=1 Tax=Paenibacillus sp. FSL R10-2734 TaxID=2954691 RepID=UPI0030DCDC04
MLNLAKHTNELLTAKDMLARLYKDMPYVRVCGMYNKADLLRKLSEWQMQAVTNA